MQYFKLYPFGFHGQNLQFAHLKAAVFAAQGGNVNVSELLLKHRKSDSERAAEEAEFFGRLEAWAAVSNRQ